MVTTGEDVEILLNRPPPPLQSLGEDEGAVHSGGGPRSAARSNHT